MNRDNPRRRCKANTAFVDNAIPVNRPVLCQLAMRNTEPKREKKATEQERERERQQQTEAERHKQTLGRETDIQDRESGLKSLLTRGCAEG